MPHERMMRKLVAMTLATAALIAGLAGVAGPAAGQAGGPQPNRLGQPLLDSEGHPRDDAFNRVPLRPEDQRYGAIDGDRLKGYVDEIIQISLNDRDRGNVFWGRNAGTQGHVDTQDWMEAHFRRHGLENIYREPLALPTQWHPRSWKITFSSGGRSFELESARPARLGADTPAGGLDFDLVWVGMGLPADYIDRDVRGKAVLIHDIPLPGELRHSIRLEDSIERAFEHGAAAVGIVYGLSDNFALWQVVPGGPGFNLGYEDGRELLELLGRGESVRVNYQLSADRVDGLETAHVWGTLPGTTNEDIIIVAHIDGYFHAALDNGTGLAAMVGLVEHFAAIPRSERRRNIRFMASAGHHGGAPGTRSLRENGRNEFANTVLLINLEHVAMVDTKYWGNTLRKSNVVAPMRWWVYGSQELLDVSLDSFARFNVGLTADMETSAGGEIGAVHRDVPSIQLITSREIKHTESETREWIPAIGLEQITRAYAHLIDGVNKLDREQIVQE